jgi:hypothetical protein
MHGNRTFEVGVGETFAGAMNAYISILESNNMYGLKFGIKQMRLACQEDPQRIVFRDDTLQDIFDNFADDGIQTINGTNLSNVTVITLHLVCKSTGG